MSTAPSINDGEPAHAATTRLESPPTWPRGEATTSRPTTGRRRKGRVAGGVRGPGAAQRDRPERPDGRYAHVALVGTYPPTQCGIATFTSNLRSAIASPNSPWGVGVVRVTDAVGATERDACVVSTWHNGDRESLRCALATLNTFDAVILQHEYGIFAGPDGDEVLALIDGLRVPLITVVHTALVDPGPHQRQVLERILEASTRIVVQSDAARSRILATHAARASAIAVIPHGAEKNLSSQARWIGGAPTVLTWGLLSPGKGIEHAIAAVASLWPVHPTLSYVIAGRTHPKVRAEHGEQYRRALQALAQGLGSRGRIRFDNQYRDWASLRRLVRSADVVVLPYDSRDQVSSGVLVEAVASGKPIVATRFPHALELLGSGAGLLVDQGDVPAMAHAIDRILGEPGLAGLLAERTRALAESLQWPSVGAAYRDLLDEVTLRAVST